MSPAAGLAPHVSAIAPANGIFYAIGDIHGRFDLLKGVTAELRRAVAESGWAGDKVVAVFLGDYIDRGPDTRALISHLIDFRDEAVCETNFLRGNHEQILLDLIDGAPEAVRWLEYGGLETLRSYGWRQPHPVGVRDAAKLADRVRKVLPPEHVQFLRDTMSYVDRGEYLFVHAGLRPDRLLNEQSDADLLWF